MNALAPISTTSAALSASLAYHAVAARGAYAPNTERALKADILVWSSWCLSVSRVALPASPETVAAFIDALSANKSPATIRRAVSSVAHYHRAAGCQNPCDSLDVKLALKRLHREKGHAQQQAAPLNRPLVEKMLTAAGTGLRDLRNKALLAVAYDTLCRRSELVALTVADVETAPAGDGTVLVRRSKTDQEGAGMVRYIHADTMRHLAVFRLAAGLEAGSLFPAINRGGRLGVALDGQDVARIFKTMALAAGLTVAEAARVSGHSSRVGAAQDMARHGIEMPSIMQAGGWRTAEMVSRYCARLDARHSGAAKLAMMQDRG